MKVIIPIPIGNAEFVSSTVIENDHPGWSNVTNYAIGNRVISTTTHRKYEAVAASGPGSGGAVDPTGSGAIGKWIDVGPTNRWAMFDEAIATVTTEADSIVVVLKPGKVTPALVIIGAAAATWAVSVTDQGGVGPNTQTFSGAFDTSYVDGWDEYMTAPVVFNSDLVLTGLPLFSDPQITITLARTGDTVGVSALIVGGLVEIGAPMYGLTMGIQDYSRKETDAFGATTLVQRAFSRKVEVRLQCDAITLNSVYGMLSTLRATPVVWVPVDQAGREATIVYGWYRDFSVDLAGPRHFFCTLQLEGLT
ncbi:MAG: hypothetical protein ABS84_14925 [Rubrivivax sp. SCN 71-131]|nr:MAG: hypothetical protein ABS84_14925 [Rubrivivax sp. SCN 71-131]